MARKKIHLLRRGTGWDTLHALFFTAIVVAVAGFGFKLRPVKRTATDAVARQGSQLLLVDKMSKAERAGAVRWYMVQDPTIPARGDAGVGFAVVPAMETMLVRVASLPRAVDPPGDVPAMPEAPALAAIVPAERTALADFPLPVADAPDVVMLYQADGSLLPSPGLFRNIPAGKAEHPTIIRTIPVGGGLSRLVLTESCGDATLDSFARQELAKMKFHAGNVITVCWPSSVRSK